MDKIVPMEYVLVNLVALESIVKNVIPVNLILVKMVGIVMMENVLAPFTVKENDVKNAGVSPFLMKVSN